MEKDTKITEKDTITITVPGTGAAYHKRGILLAPPPQETVTFCHADGREISTHEFLKKEAGFINIPASSKFEEWNTFFKSRFGGTAGNSGFACRTGWQVPAVIYSFQSCGIGYTLERVAEPLRQEIVALLERIGATLPDRVECPENHKDYEVVYRFLFPIERKIGSGHHTRYLFKR